MKNIFRILLTIIISGAFFISCEEEETNFDALTTEPDAGAPFYVQFIDAAQKLESGVTEAGELIDIETTVAVSIMGMPQSQDINVSFAIDPATTIDEGMYNMSGTSITIPAGGTSGSVTLSTITENMPAGETLQLVLNLDAGDNNSPSENGTKLTYDLTRLAFCPLENGVPDLVGTYSGNDGQGDYTSGASVTASMNGTDLEFSAGLGFGFIADFWAETVTTGGNFTMKINGNGTIDIPRQYLFTTVYDGAPYDYEIAGTGKWENCDDKPKIILEYDIYYPGDEAGLAQTYSSYLGGIPYLTADLTMQ